MAVVENQYLTTFKVLRGFEEVQQLYELLQGEAYIAGSYAAFMAAPYPETLILPNDIDVFATTDAAAIRIASALIGVPLHYTFDENETAFTIHRASPDLDVQVLKPNPKWQKFPGDILNDFDFDICRAVLIAPDEVRADTGIMRMREGKILRVNNALRSLKRVLKYTARGVKFDDHELLKLFQAWEQMELTAKKRILARAEEESRPVDSAAWSYGDDDWFEGE